MTEWEQMTEFNNYFVEKGKEFAALYPNECSGVEVITLPYAGYEAKFLSGFNANSQVCDFFKGMPHIWAGLYNFADPMPKAMADRLDKELVSYLQPIGIYNGTRYGYPVEAGNFQQLYINEDMFIAAGLDPNTPPETFDELLEYAKKLTKYDAGGNVTVAGFALRYSGEGQGVADKNLTILHAFGGKMFDSAAQVATGAVNSPDAVKGLEWIKRCLDEKVTSLDIGIPETAFGQGRAAMIMRESWVSGWLDINAPNIKYRIFPAPLAKVAIGGGNLFPWANMVYSNSPNKEIAWRFLDFCLTNENDLEQSQRQGLLPVMAAGYSSDYVKQRIDYESASEMIRRGPGPAYDYYIPEMNQLASIFGSAIQDVMYGRLTPQTALDGAAKNMDQVLRN
jgi:multiple sugar transport system substrate-binding protein